MPINHSELDFWFDSEARASADAKHERLQLAEVEPIRRCCDEPDNFDCIPSLNRDLDTGYLEGSYYQCRICNSRICEEDFALIVQWADSREGQVVRMEPNPIPAEFEEPVKKTEAA